MTDFVRIILAAIALFALYSFLHTLVYRNDHPPDLIRPFQPNEGARRELAQHCAHIRPIAPEEFHARQRALAQVLYDNGNGTYVAEPGAYAQYFGNVSASAWRLSERPLLLVVSPEIEMGAEGGGVSVRPRLTIVTPTFEADRAHLLDVPSRSNVSYVSWNEDADPYAVAASVFAEGSGPVFVDGAMRTFVKDGLARSAKGRDVVSAPKEITTLREQKSEAELEILKCANEVRSVTVCGLTPALMASVGHSEGDSRCSERPEDCAWNYPRPFDAMLSLFGKGHDRV